MRLLLWTTGDCNATLIVLKSKEVYSMTRSTRSYGRALLSSLTCEAQGSDDEFYDAEEQLPDDADDVVITPTELVPNRPSAVELPVSAPAPVAPARGQQAAQPQQAPAPKQIVKFTRRVAIPTKPDKKISLWGFMKNCIGKVSAVKASQG